MKLYIVILLIFSVYLIQAQSFSDLTRKINDYYFQCIDGNKDNKRLQEIEEAIKKLLEKEGDEIVVSELDKEGLADLNKYLNDLKSGKISENGVSSSIYNFYISFANLFHENYKELFNKSNRDKIIFVTVSVTCDCSRKMSNENLDDIIKYVHKKMNYDVIIEDMWNYVYFKEKYKVKFVPTTILLDEQNNEKGIFIREEHLYDKLLSRKE